MSADLQPTSPSESQKVSNGKWPLPYYTVIFTSRRHAPPSSTSSDEALYSSNADYATTATAMFALAKAQPGYLGVESHHTVQADGSVSGITVSYWSDAESIRAWRAVTEHVEARRRGKAEWYRAWNVRVAKVEREYGAGWDSVVD